MLDDTQAAFAAEMQAKPPLRPSGIRHRAAVIDTMSGAGAARLAQTIKSFWSAAGFEVSIDIVPFAAGKGHELRVALLHDRRPTASADQ